MLKKLLCVFLLFVILFFALGPLGQWLRKLSIPKVIAIENEPSFVGDSSELNETRIALTLDAPLEENENVVWCGSFQAAWKTLQVDALNEPVELEGAEEAAVSLNESFDPRSVIPSDSIYAVTGIVEDGILDEIESEMNQRFPDHDIPDFQGLRPDSLVSYAYMEMQCRFEIPYFQNDDPMRFTNFDGVETEVQSFGNRRPDYTLADELRFQPEVLFTERGLDEYQQEVLEEFIIDLDCESSPHQVILALVEPCETLAATLQMVDEKIASGSKKSLGPDDELLVPNIAFDISHDFDELLDAVLKNESERGRFIQAAHQNINFSLNRFGADLESEAMLETLTCAVVNNYFFNRPFLLVMKTRNKPLPYFVMWVANAELLTPF